MCFVLENSCVNCGVVMTCVVKTCDKSRGDLICVSIDYMEAEVARMKSLGLSRVCLRSFMNIQRVQNRFMDHKCSVDTEVDMYGPETPESSFSS